MAKAETELLQEIKERFKESEDAFSEAREQFKRDVRFRYGEQWDDQDLRRRKERGKPCLVFNRINPTIRQITNDQKQNSPSPEAIPVDDHNDPATAEVIQGMIRYILNGSNAKAAFSTAFEHAVTGGFGFFRVLTEYADERSFNLDIKIKRIINPLSVYFDPHSTEVDGSDAEWAFVTEELSIEKYKRLYRKSDLAKHDLFRTGDNPFILNDKTTRIAEYFYSDYQEKTLLLLSNGQTLFEDELDQEYLFANGLSVIEGTTRKVTVRQIKWVKTNGCEILEATDWPGRWIPIIPVYGEEYYLDGKIHRRGMVADARDPQMAFNALESAKIEAIALAPKAPWLVTPKNIDRFKPIWDRSDENLPYLPFEPDQSGFVPQRISVEPPIAAITQAALHAAENLKATTGVFDAALGAQSNETSGVAIQKRTMQAQTSNYHYQDNFDASLQHCGRILVDLIPKIYDTERAVRILGNEDEIKTVIINSQNPDGDGRIYDLSACKYDIRITSGPSYMSKRQEAAASMMQIAQAAPQIMGIAGDLMVKAMDWPKAQEVAERIRRTIPPHILGDENQIQLPPEVQAQVQQMQAAIQTLQAELEKAKNPLIAKEMELQSKERIETLKIEKDLEIERMKLQANLGDFGAALQAITAQIAQIEARLNFLDQMNAAQMPPQVAPGEMPADVAAMQSNGIETGELEQAGMLAPEAFGLPNDQLPTGGDIAPGSPMEADHV